MNIKTIEDIVALIAKRDNISMNEALILVECCRAEIDYVLSEEGEEIDDIMYEEICNIVQSWLGLEPDFIDILIGV